MNTVINDLKLTLNKQSNKSIAKSMQRFFKEKLNFYGISSAAIGKISREYFSKIKSLPKEQIFNLCEELFKSKIWEESQIACNWSYNVKKEYKPEDFNTFKRWIGKYVNNWATCDTLCNHTVGEFVEQYPEYVKELIKFTSSTNLWVKRASAVSLIVPAKSGKFFSEGLKIATLLLEDPNDLVQKGYGWLLKVYSQVYLQEVFNYVMDNKKRMPRTALRYAIEKMPKELKVKAMEK